MSWLSVLVESCEENESPPKFFYWCGLAAISAVMKKQVYTDRFFYNLYPNIYVFLVAGSGMKKGIPISVAKRLVEKTKTCRIISGRNSMPRIVQDLGKAFTLENGAMISNAQGFIISGELAAFLVKEQDAMTVLTDLHNTHEHELFWINSLKGSGVDKLKEPCLTLLGATNEDHFVEAVPNSAVGGGFIARTFIVFSLDKGKLNSLTRPPKKVVDVVFLAEYLKELTKIKGKFTWTDAAIKVYDNWYYKFMGSNGNDKTGTNNRVGDQIIKAAMLIALSETPDLILKESHILEAINVSTECISGMRQVTMGAGRHNLAQQQKLVFRELIIAKDNKVER
ncbi:MAG TPA: hypothetical protein VNX68_12670, partial [Nitrosopumilaceae archaeon]|nr:hypothetical protein [Nitrosopumilaceae archaeon]